MRPSDVKATLLELIPTREPVLLWGPPGVGKSAILGQVAQTLELEVIDRRLPYMDPVDAGGFPMANGDTMKFSRPDFIPQEGKGIVFLDEFGQSVPLVQSAMCQFLLDRQIRDHRLGDGWTIIAASNRNEDRAGANRIITPILNRLIHLDVEVSNDDWQEWALGFGLAPEVRAFLKFRPNLLHNFDATKNERAFPTPRSWHKLSNVLNVLHADRLMPVASGVVGEGPAAEFIAYIQYYRSIPDLDDVLKHPEKSPVPREAAVLWGLSTAIVDKIAKSAADLLGRGITYIRRLPKEFSILTMRELCSVNKAVYKVPEAVKWLAENREYLGVK